MHATPTTLLCCLFFLPLISSFSNINELLKQKNERPPTGRRRPLDVRLGMYLESVGNFRSNEMSFDVDIYVYMSWRDSRLQHRGPDYVMVNDDETRQKMWLPDLYFANARHATFQKVLVPNFNLFIAPDGQIAYSCRCTLTVACSLDLRFYPMDHQMCSIRVLSYAYIASQVNVTWFDENPIAVNPEVALPEFNIAKLESSYCDGKYRYALMPDSYKYDKFSCLSGNIFLSRSIGYNLLQSYIPTSLIVMISWVSFWIDRRAVPARVTLSFTTLVSFTTLLKGSGLRFGLAQVSYAKAIDLWYGACMLFVFLALLEFAIINNFMRKSEKYEMMARRMQEEVKRRQKSMTRQFSVIASSPLLDRKKSTAPPPPELNGGGRRRKDTLADIDGSWGELMDEYSKHVEVTGEQEDSVHFFTQMSKNHSRHALKIDQLSRFCFPTMFVIFNIIYWWYYLIYKA